MLVVLSWIFNGSALWMEEAKHLELWTVVPLVKFASQTLLYLSVISEDLIYHFLAHAFGRNGRSA